MSIEGGKLILRIIRAKWRDETSFVDDHDGVIDADRHLFAASTQTRLLSTHNP